MSSGSRHEGSPLSIPYSNEWYPENKTILPKPISVSVTTNKASVGPTPLTPHSISWPWQDGDYAGSLMYKIAPGPWRSLSAGKAGMSSARCLGVENYRALCRDGCSFHIWAIHHSRLSVPGAMACTADEFFLLQ